MVRYLRDCFGFFHLRYATLIIAVLEIAFSIYFIEDGLTHTGEKRKTAIKIIPMGNYSLPPQNATSPSQDLHPPRKKESGAAITVALVGSLNILAAIALFICGLLNKPVLRMLLIVWICWTTAVIVLACAIIIFYLTIAHSVLDGLRVFMIYGCGMLLEMLCIWVVASYFKYLGIMAHGPAQGYRVVFNSRGAEPQHMHRERPSITSEPHSYATSTHSMTSLEMVDVSNANTDIKAIV